MLGGREVTENAENSAGRGRSPPSLPRNAAATKTKSQQTYQHSRSGSRRAAVQIYKAARCASGEVPPGSAASAVSQSELLEPRCEQRARTGPAPMAGLIGGRQSNVKEHRPAHAKTKEKGERQKRASYGGGDGMHRAGQMRERPTPERVTTTDMSLVIPPD